MALTFEEDKSLVELKHKQAKELIDLKASDRKVEHDQKVQRLELQLKIAKEGGEKIG